MEKELNLFKLDIQFFAEDDENLDDEFKPDDEDDDEDVDDVDDEDEDLDDFDDSNEDDGNEDSDDDSKDDGKDTPKDDKPKDDKPKDEPKNEEKKKQTREENARYKQLRKEEELRKSELEKARKDAVNEFIKERYKVNTFTDEPLDDDYSIEVFKIQLEMHEKGLDPVKDFPKYYAEMQRANAKKLEEKRQKDEWFAKDFNDFKEVYPDVDIEELDKNEEFVKFSKGKIGNVPLKEIYEDFKATEDSINQEVERRVKEEVEKRVAKALSSPNSVKDTSSNDNETYYTLEQLQSMTSEELDKNWKKVERSYNKILKK